MQFMRGEEVFGRVDIFRVRREVRREVRRGGRKFLEGGGGGGFEVGGDGMGGWGERRDKVDKVVSEAKYIPIIRQSTAA